MTAPFNSGGHAGAKQVPTAPLFISVPACLSATCSGHHRRACGAAHTATAGPRPRAELDASRTSALCSPTQGLPTTGERNPS
eukprot:8543617-Alexandrium_andersonii.AAC.1